MARHRRFTDNAGYTRHCWECLHAKGWRPDAYEFMQADCELTGKTVNRYNSPNNQCCHMPADCRYETEVDESE